MKITNLKINQFGKLQNKEIYLKDGINIIYGKNEAGKSTLLQFILGMFYGLSKNKNGKFISDSQKYTPWQGGEFSGKIGYELDDGTKYEVFRDFKKKNPIIFNEQLEDISSTFHIDKTLGNQFFFDQTKVDEELFTNTIVSFQDEVKLNEKEQNALVQKMSNMASTGEDNLSFQKTIAKLNKKQIEEIGTNRTQDRPINIIEKRMQEIQNEKEEYLPYTTKQYAIEEEKKELEKNIKEQENRLELLKKVKQLVEKQELEKQKLKINEETIKEYSKKIEKLKQIDIKEEKASQKETKNKLIKIKNEGKNILIAVIASIIFAISASLSLTLIKNDILSSICIVLSIVFAIYAGYKKNQKNTQKTVELEPKKSQSHEHEIEILNNSIQNLKQQKDVENEKLKKEREEETEKLRNEYLGIIPIKAIDEILLSTEPAGELNILQNKINDNKIRLHTITKDKFEIAEKIEKLVNLEEEYVNLEEQYEELIKNNELINLVKEEIQKAYDTMKKNVTPQFTKELSKIIEKISNGKYKNIQLDEENGMIVEVENGNYLPAKHLSIGTIDQLYLSLRLGTINQLSRRKFANNFR